jgi:hypothetical protein
MPPELSCQAKLHKRSITVANKISVNNLVRSNIFLSAADKKAMQVRAKSEGVSYATLTRQAIAAFLGSKAESFSFRTAR